MENNVFKIRVVADTEEDIFIDIKAVKECKLITIHNLLIKAFDLDNKEMASFYFSNNNWDKGEEITLFNMSIEEEEQVTKSMEDTALESLYENGIVKLLYLHDFLNLNIFYLEFLESDHSNMNEIAKITHQLGKYTPKQFNEENNTTLAEENDPIKDILDEYNEDDFGSFEELDEDLY
jgi:hypothetical protein